VTLDILTIALVQASMRRAAMPADVVLIELPWFPLSVPIHAAWRRRDPGPLVAEFAAALET